MARLCKNDEMRKLKELLPAWADAWLDVITVSLQIALIVFVALLLRTVIHRFINKLGKDRRLPPEFVVGGRRLFSIVLFSAALLLSLDRVGVSGTVIWTAITGFAAVAAVAFFAAWSVLSNIFCSLLIYITRPFGLNDHVELLENGEVKGLGGVVIDINLIYTTLKESPSPEGIDASATSVQAVPLSRPPVYLRIPNSWFFQRTLRLRTDEATLHSVLG